MRHLKVGKKLGRTASHRKATLRALSASLIKHHRIVTTLAKAKELRRFVEPVVTKAKEDTPHHRQQVFAFLQDKEAVTHLFEEVGALVADRPGGYTRIIKLGPRKGDGAEMAMIELVDYNDVQPEGGKTKRKRTRRGGGGRRSRKKSAQKPTEQKKKAEEAPAEAKTEEVEEKPKADKDTPQQKEETETTAEAVETADAKKDTSEEKAETSSKAKEEEAEEAEKETKSQATSKKTKAEDKKEDKEEEDSSNKK